MTPPRSRAASARTRAAARLLALSLLAIILLVPSASAAPALGINLLPNVEHVACDTVVVSVLCHLSDQAIQLLSDPIGYIGNLIHEAIRLLVVVPIEWAFRALGDAFSWSFNVVADAFLWVWGFFNGVFTNVGIALYYAGYAPLAALSTVFNGVETSLTSSFPALGPVAPLASALVVSPLIAGIGYVAFVAVRAAISIVRLGVNLL